MILGRDALHEEVLLEVGMDDANSFICCELLEMSPGHLASAPGLSPLELLVLFCTELLDITSLGRVNHASS